MEISPYSPSQVRYPHFRPCRRANKGGGWAQCKGIAFAGSVSFQRVGGGKDLGQLTFLILPHHNEQHTGDSHTLSLMCQFISNPPASFLPLIACYFSPCPAKKRDPPIGKFHPQGKAFHRRENLFLNFQCTHNQLILLLIPPVMLPVKRTGGTADKVWLIRPKPHD